MAANFHESYSVGEIKPPSERATGLLFAVVAVIVAVFTRQSAVVPWVALAIALMLVGMALATPSLLKPLNILWFRFGLLLHRIVNPMIMLFLFGVVFLPAGLVMRLWYDPLRSRRQAGTYWIEPDSVGRPNHSMTNQY